MPPHEYYYYQLVIGRAWLHIGRRIPYPTLPLLCPRGEIGFKISVSPLSFSIGNRIVPSLFSTVFISKDNLEALDGTLWPFSCTVPDHQLHVMLISLLVECMSRQAGVRCFSHYCLHLIQPALAGCTFHLK